MCLSFAPWKSGPMWISQGMSVMCWVQVSSILGCYTSWHSIRRRNSKAWRHDASSHLHQGVESTSHHTNAAAEVRAVCLKFHRSITTNPKHQLFFLLSVPQNQTAAEKALPLNGKQPQIDPCEMGRFWEEGSAPTADKVDYCTNNQGYITWRYTDTFSTNCIISSAF